MMTIKYGVKIMDSDYSDKRVLTGVLGNFFCNGIGSILSLDGSHREMSIGSLETDAEQIRADWEAIGREIWSAYRIESDK